MKRLDDVDGKRTRRRIGVTLLAVATAVSLWTGPKAFGELGLGERWPAPSVGEREADFVVVARSREGIDSPVSRVALQTIASHLRSDPAVASVRISEPSRDRRRARIQARLSPDLASERRAAVSRLSDSIDPGPLTISIAGAETARAQRADEIRDVAALATLVATPLLAGLLILIFGWGPTAVLAGMVSVLTTCTALTILRLLNGPLDIHLQFAMATPLLTIPASILWLWRFSRRSGSL